MITLDDIAKKSLDADIAECVTNTRAPITTGILLQMLRIMRGRPFNVELNPPKQTGGWSADGNTWLDKEPG